MNRRDFIRKGSLFVPAAMCSVRLVQAAITMPQSTKSTALGTSVPCSFATPPTVGNTIIVAGTTYNTTMTCADNRGNSYGTPVTHFQEPGLVHPYLFAASVVTSSAPFTVTITVAASSYLLLRIYEFAGLDNASLVDTSATANTTGVVNPVPAGSITTTNANDLLFMTVGSQTTATWANSGGIWNAGESYGNAVATVITAWDQWRVVSSTLSGHVANMGFNVGVGGSASLIAAFKEAGGGSPTPVIRRRVIQ